MSDTNTSLNTEQPSTTPTPEDAGGQGGEKMFSQADVNRIVSERLAREKAKAEPSAIDERENALKAREARLECRDFLEGLGGKAASGVKVLLDILDTSDSEKFKKTVNALLEAGAFNPQLEQLKLPRTDYRGSGGPDPIAAAFRLKN